MIYRDQVDGKTFVAGRLDKTAKENRNVQFLLHCPQKAHLDEKLNPAR